MLPFARIATFFGAAVFVALIVVALVGTYVLDQYEPVWGRGASFQVFIWLSVLAWLLSFFGALIGARFAGSRRAVPDWAPVGTAIFFLGLTMLALWLLSVVQPDANGFAMAVWFLSTPAVLCFILVRLLGREQIRDV